jgi:REP element-mobilizing transposase RayT
VHREDAGGVVTYLLVSYRGAAATYFITFRCYGSWLHGEDGSVDREHNAPGSPLMEADRVRLNHVRGLMKDDVYVLDLPRQKVVLAALIETCLCRDWILIAAHARSSHVHVIVEGNRSPEYVMATLKSYASRALNRSHLDAPGRRRWALHGSNRYLWHRDEVARAVEYVVNEQGEPMAVFKRLPR